MDQIERVVLAQLIFHHPKYNDLAGLKKTDFSTENSKRIFGAIKKCKQNYPRENLSALEIHRLSGVDIDVILKLDEGVHKFPRESLKKHVRFLRERQIYKEFFKESKKQQDFFLKDIPPDLAKLRHFLDEVEHFQKGDDDARWIKLNSVESKAIDFLWWNRIPRGSITLLVGDPGDGKSTLAIHLSSKITQGESLPDNYGPSSKGSVLYLTAEDNLGDTVRPRAEDAGADLEKFIVLEDDLKRNFFSIQNDLQLLENKIISLKDVQVVIFDPITAFMGDIEANKMTAVRVALAPLTSLAEKHNVAIIAITHLNKDTAKKAIYRTLGSIGFVAAARTVWLIQRDEDDINRERRFLAPLKHNICKDPTTLAFTISGDIGHPKIEFESGPVNITSEELLADAEGKERYSAMRDAEKFLVESLKDEGRHAATEILDDAKKLGIAERTLMRAKSKLNVSSTKEGNQWFWQL